MSITDFCLVDKVRIFLQNNKQADNKNITPMAKQNQNGFWRNADAANLTRLQYRMQ